jgi:hypothetical protein
VDQALQQQQEKVTLAQAIVFGRERKEDTGGYTHGYDPEPDMWGTAVPILETAFAMNYSQSVDTFIAEIGLEMGEECNFSTREEREQWGVQE